MKIYNPPLGMLMSSLMIAALINIYNIIQLLFPLVPMFTLEEHRNNPSNTWSGIRGQNTFARGLSWTTIGGEQWVS